MSISKAAKNTTYLKKRPVMLIICNYINIFDYDSLIFKNQSISINIGGGEVRKQKEVVKWSRRLQDLEQELEAQDFGAGSSRRLYFEQKAPGVGAGGSSLWGNSLQDLEQEAPGPVVQRSCSAQGALKFKKGKMIFLTAIRCRILHLIRRLL